MQAIFNKLGCREYCACNMPMNKRNMIQKVSSLSLEAYVNKWSDSINTQAGVRGNGKNKLRTYRLFKNTFNTEPCCSMLLPLKHRAAFAKIPLWYSPYSYRNGAI